MKSAGKARNNGLYRHIRTSKEIIRNLLNDLLNTKIDVKNGTQTKTIQGNIKFEDVTFYYEEKKPVLHDVFMEFKKGEIYAILHNC